jgi:hypothetical protein
MAALVGSDTRFADERQLHDYRALRLLVLQECIEVHAVDELANPVCGVQHLRRIDAVTSHRWF